MNKEFSLKYLIKGAVIITTASLFVLQVSCEDYTTSTPLKEKNDSIISTRIFNAKFNLKDSGYSKVYLTSPEVIMYELIDTPQTIFPIGLEIKFYKKDNPKPGFLRASYAKIIEKKQWYEAKGNVVVINNEGDTLKSQQLFWNKKTRMIYTTDTTYIITKDGTTNRSLGGVKAREDFKEYELIKNSGLVNIKE